MGLGSLGDHVPHADDHDAAMGDGPEGNDRPAERKKARRACTQRAARKNVELRRIRAL
jgi:hypothetical protein